MTRTAVAKAVLSLLVCGALLPSRVRPFSVAQPFATPQDAKVQTFGGKIVSQNEVRFVLKDYDNDVWYHIDDQQKAGSHLGQYVLITGTFDGLTGTIRVRNIVEATPDEVTAANTAKREMEITSRPPTPPPPTPHTSSPTPLSQIPPSATPPSSTAPLKPAPAIPAPHAERPATPPVPPLRSAEAEVSHSSVREAPLTSVVALPEEAVSASSSVAISSRRFVPMPSNYQSQEQFAKNLAVGKLLNRVSPYYPVAAREQGIEGTVRLHAVIGQDGRVQSVQPVSGSPLLSDAALTAVREWRYAPTLFEGHRVVVQDDIKLVFRLPN